MTLDELRLRVQDHTARHAPVWDTHWARRSIGRIAVGILPTPETVKRAERALAAVSWPEPAEKPAGWTLEWRSSVEKDVAGLVAALAMPGDRCLALSPPRFVHHQSQGICDLFGARVEAQADGNFYVHPLPPDPAFIDAVMPKSIEQSAYWGAVEWIRYARTMTGGLFEFSNPVMTGPFDTANYLLGTTTLMEWVYSEPETLHRLLDKITDVLIAMIGALRTATGGRIYRPRHAVCVRGGYDFGSECRALVSRNIYETFEAPRLRRIGATAGPYGIHSCGSWERTVPSALSDPNLRIMNGQIRENDLAQLCALANGGITLSIGPSANLDERYTWSRKEDFYAHVLRTVPRTQPFEIGVSEDELALWNRLCVELNVTYNQVPMCV
ncbi:MAG: uroporphyrinogen decarboxylase family protein [Verrucomicrobiota bacterium]